MRGHRGGHSVPTREGQLLAAKLDSGRRPAPLPAPAPPPIAPNCHCHQLAIPGRPRRQAGERSLAELRDFAAALKALPHIQRHIGLAEAVNKVIAAPAFRGRVAVEQALLDGHGTDASAEAIEARAPRARLGTAVTLPYHCAPRALPARGAGGAAGRAARAARPRERAARLQGGRGRGGGVRGGARRGGAALRVQHAWT